MGCEAKSGLALSLAPVERAYVEWLAERRDCTFTEAYQMARAAQEQPTPPPPLSPPPAAPPALDPAELGPRFAAVFYFLVANGYEPDAIWKLTPKQTFALAAFVARGPADGDSLAIN